MFKQFEQQQNVSHVEAFHKGRALSKSIMNNTQHAASKASSLQVVEYSKTTKAKRKDAATICSQFFLIFF